MQVLGIIALFFIKAFLFSLVSFHSKRKLLGVVTEFFAKHSCAFSTENLPRPVVYSVLSLPV